MPKTSTPGAQLRLAASQGNIDKVKEFLDADFINASSSNGNTALHWSIIKQHYHVTKLLLAISGIDVDLKNTEGQTPLHIATLQGDKKTVYRLLKAGAGQKNITDREGFSALDYACKKSDSFIVTLLKKKFPEWKFKDEDKLAVEIYEKFKKNNPSIISNSQIFDFNYLFDAKVAPYFQPANQYTLTNIKQAIEKRILDPHKLFVSGNLLQGAALSRVDTLKKFRWLLLEKDVDPNLQGSYELNPSSYKNTALHTLIANEDEQDALKLIELLVSTKRFNFDLTDSEEKTCLCLAVKIGLSEVAKKLISLKNQVDINIPDEDGNTPLHYAFLLGHISIADELIKNQCRINSKNKQNQTPYELLITSTEEDVRDCLETIWINPDRKLRNSQKTMLQQCMENREEARKKWFGSQLPLLIDQRKRIICFHLAAAKGDLKSLQDHCDATTLNQVNSKGNTALHLASAHGHEELVKYLLEYSEIDLHKINHENLKAADQVNNLTLANLFKEKLSINLKGSTEERKDTLNRLERRIQDLSLNIEAPLSLKNH